jgi:hypothetical protein
MKLTSINPQIDLVLQRRQLISLENARPKMAIKSDQGTLWVTVSGDNQDHMLYSGQRYAVPGTKGKVVIEALENAKLRIEEMNN